MKTITRQSKQGTVEICLPIFRKTTTVYGKVVKYIAVLESEQVISIVKMDDFVSVVHCNIKTTPEDIVSVFATWETIDESDFIKYHESELRSLSLTPVLVEPDPNDLKDINI